MKRWETHLWYQRRLGFLGGLGWSLATAADRRGLVRGPISIRPPWLSQPLYVRLGGSSDADLFGDIFLCGALDFLRVPTRTIHPD